MVSATWLLYSVDKPRFVHTSAGRRLTNLVYCNCIVTRGGVYDEILPEAKGFPEGSGDISSYTPTRVTIQSFKITSISQYFLIFAP